MSFYYAVSGIWNAMRNEKNLRFHFMIAVLICIFAGFYKLTATKWAILVLNIGAVISAELLNTAIENAIDTATTEILPTAKLAKDAGAGAVLVLAVLSVVDGFFLFNSIDRIKATLGYIFSKPANYVPCIVTGLILLIFVIFGGKNGKEI